MITMLIVIIALLLLGKLTALLFLISMWARHAKDNADVTYHACGGNWWGYFWNYMSLQVDMWRKL